MSDLLKEFLLKIWNFCTLTIATLPNDVKDIVTISPSQLSSTSFDMVKNINSALIPIAISILVAMFLIEYVGKSLNPEWVNVPNVIMFFARLLVAKWVVVNSKDILMIIYDVSTSVTNAVGTKSMTFVMEDDVISTSINNIGGGISGVLLMIGYVVAVLILGLIILFCSIFVKIIAYGRIIELMLLIAVAPVPFVTFVGDQKNIAIRFIQSFASVCLQGAVILLITSIVSSFYTNITSSSTGDFGEILFKFIVVICIYTTALAKSEAISKSIMGM